MLSSLGGRSSIHRVYTAPCTCTPCPSLQHDGVKSTISGFASS